MKVVLHADVRICFFIKWLSVKRVVKVWFLDCINYQLMAKLTQSFFLKVVFNFRVIITHFQQFIKEFLLQVLKEVWSCLLFTYVAPD
jgi:hypothetical protein